MKNNTYNYEDPLYCPLSRSVNMLSGRWSSIILHIIGTQKTCRFTEFQDKMPSISRSMLSSSLRKLEKKGLILRHEVSVMPSHVEYKLTPLGKKLMPILEKLYLWGEGLPKE